MANLPVLRFSRLFVPIQSRFCSTNSGKNAMSAENEDLLIKKFATPDDDPDAPIVLKGGNPFTKTEEKCLLCKYDIKLDYKNTRLLQQFVSNFSGRVYDQHVTGLCTPQYMALLRAVKYSRKAGLMPILTKDPRFLRDPKIFDPMRPTRPHSYDNY